jgi:hypothetical protein
MHGIEDVTDMFFGGIDDTKKSENLFIYVLWLKFLLV